MILPAPVPQRGFLHVSEVEGGFTALHQRRAHFLAAELVNHVPEHCMVCSGGRALATYAALRERDGFENVFGAVSSPQPRPLGSTRRAAPAVHGPYGGTPGSSSGPQSADTCDDRKPGGAAMAAGAARQWLAALVAVPESSVPSAAHNSHASAPALQTPLQGQAARDVAQSAPVAASAPPPTPATSRRPSGGATGRTLDVGTTEQSVASFLAGAPSSPPDLLFDGVDLHGLPLLSEQALLDIQCDALERACEAATGRLVIPASVPPPRRQQRRQRVARLPRPLPPRAAPEVVYVEDVLFSAAAATATVLQRFVSTPEPGSAPPPRAVNPRARLSAAEGPAAHGSIPTLSLAEFMAAPDAVGSRPEHASAGSPAPPSSGSDSGSAAAGAARPVLPPMEIPASRQLARQLSAPASAAVGDPKPATLPPAPSPARPRSITHSLASLAAAALSAPPPSGVPQASAASQRRSSVPRGEAASSSAAPQAKAATEAPTPPPLPPATARHLPLAPPTTTGVRVTAANSRYLDTIRRAALAGLESMQPPRR